MDLTRKQLTNQEPTPGGIGGPMLGSALIGSGLALDAIFYILAGIAVVGIGLTLLVPLSRSAPTSGALR